MGYNNWFCKWHALKQCDGYIISDIHFALLFDVVAHRVVEIEMKHDTSWFDVAAGCYMHQPIKITTVKSLFFLQN